VLVDTGAGAQMAEGLLAWGLTPVWLAFLLALLIRAIQGSATVAMITAAGLMGVSHINNIYCGGRNRLIPCERLRVLACQPPI